MGSLIFNLILLYWVIHCLCFLGIYEAGIRGKGISTAATAIILVLAVPLWIYGFLMAIWVTANEKETRF